MNSTGQTSIGGTYSYGSSQSFYQDPQQSHLQYTQYQQSSNNVINVCPKNVKCTYAQTGKKHIDQFWYHCMDCDQKQQKGVCPACAVVCHQGHQLSVIMHGSFFCDCGAGDLKFKCKCL
jgi:hypothetical protein